LWVFENGAQSRIFRPKREEVTRSWGRMHNELHNLYASPNIVRVIVSRKMGWAGHVARMGAMRNTYKIFVRKSEGKRPPNLGTNGRMILEWVLKT
jgi:hypothetical protein